MVRSYFLCGQLPLRLQHVLPNGQVCCFLPTTQLESRSYVYAAQPVNTAIRSFWRGRLKATSTRLKAAQIAGCIKILISTLSGSGPPTFSSFTMRPERVQQSYSHRRRCELAKCLKETVVQAIIPCSRCFEKELS